VISDDIVHYRFELRVGPGPFDVIAIHRVVKERRPYCPVRTRESIFLVHGSSGFFENGFLNPVTTPDRVIAAHLAKNDIDVWGIDLGWCFVPIETTDFSFMEGWGMAKDVDHIEMAMFVARTTRLFTGNGWRKMDFLGHSLGAILGYALLNEESQKPPGHRQVHGFIPVDFYYKTDREELRLLACESAAEDLENINNGVFQNDRFLILNLAEWARAAPEDPSPVFDWLNNLQAALLVGTSTFIFTPHTPVYHLTGGIFAPDGYPLVPVDLRFTTIEALLIKLEEFSPFIPLQLEYDYSATACGEVDVPFDDHLADITNPILYVGAVGGTGDLGLYSLTLLGSTDVTSLIIQLLPPEDWGLDYGHNDLFMADGAVELVYDPIVEWMESH
jgi:pimeloyl-ACP methyl ester carboxylesterase